MTGSEGLLDLIEKWSPALFLSGGLLWIAGATNDGLIHFAGVPSTEALSIAILNSAFLLGLIGLVGFYPRLADHSPISSKVSFGITVLTAVGALVTVVWSVLSILLPTVNVLETESAAIAIVAVTGLLFLVTPLLFGILVLSTGAFSRPVGFFLLAEAALMAFVVFGPTDELARGVFLVGAKVAHSVIFLSIGYSLRTSLTSASRQEPSPV